MDAPAPDAAATRLEFRILGPLEVLRAGVPLGIRARKHRALLALFLLSANRVVSADRLIDELWAGRPPAGAAKTLRSYISRLRTAVGEEVVRSRAPGYVLEIEPDQLDARRFEHLLSEGRQALARGDAAKAAAFLREGLALWRGSVLADLADEPFAVVEAGRLEELRLVAIEERVEADLERGRHPELVAELEALLTEHPLRERLWAQLMTALYRSGRQAEALAAYQRARTLLADQLGLETGKELQALQQKILRHELEAAPAPTPEREHMLREGLPRSRGGVKTSRREVRKIVTVLFADVTGSTSLGEQLDAESLRQVLSRYFEEMKAVVERFGGTVEKFIGDAVMAVFGVPTLHEDDARRALAAAAAMRECLVHLNAQLQHDFGVLLEARIGVNTGEVVAGFAPSGERFLTGDAVNVAARLEQAAAPGEILLGERTLELARAALEAEPIEPLALKGKKERVAAYRLLRVLEGAPAFERRLDAPLVGRQDQLRRLQRTFDEAVSERRCRLVTILGPPGIGKSRLARALAAELRGQAVVLSGGCVPYGEGSTYQPLAEIFTAAGAEDELAAALAAGPPEDISWAIRKSLERNARERPLMIVVEDLHHAEPTLLDLVEHLVDWTRDAPLLLLCNARPELLDMRPAWGAEGGSGDMLTLEPLAEAETDELIANLVGESDLGEDARTRIHQVAEGNPLFVEQLIAMRAEGDEAERVPPTIQSLLAARIDALPDDERDVLEHASIVGLEFEWEALGQLAIDGRRPPGAHLAALVRKQLIRPHEAIADAFRFRHVLIRDAAYERIPKEARSSLHERFAQWLDSRGEEFDEVIGFHLEQAHRFEVELGRQGPRVEDLAERAAERLAASGRRAHSRGDAHAATNLLERASALLSADDRRRLSVLPSLGRALTEAGDLDRADSVLSKAVEEGRAAGEHAVAADALVALLYLRAHTRQLTVDEVARELEGVIGFFEQLGDEAGLARALGLAGCLRYWRGEAAAAIGDLEQAADHARSVGDRAQLAYALQYVVAAIVDGPTPVDEGLERLEGIQASADANRRLEVTLLRARAQLEAMREGFDAARTLIASAKRLAEELGLEAVLAYGVAHQAGLIELLAGDAAAGERELRRACEALERMGDLGHLAVIAPRLADALLILNRDDEALRWTELAERSATPRLADEQIGWRRARAKILARRGEVDEAERLARQATAMADLTDGLVEHAQAEADLAEVLRLAGRLEESTTALAEAIRLHEEKGNLAAKALLVNAARDRDEFRAVGRSLPL